jgi:RNA polymerase sigma-70 factor (ECF subfamily)
MLRLMNVMMARMTAALAGAPAHRMPDALIDAETTRLAAAAQAGSVDAFNALGGLHHRAAQRVAAAALANPADVDEAVQDACLVAWQRIGRLEDPGAFRAWLLRITWRKALDRRRSVGAWLKRFQSAFVTSDATAVLDPVMTIVDRTATVHDQLLAKERDRVVEQMIRSLPVRLRDPFLLAASGEHRYEDIAAMLNIPLGTVKWRVAEARRVLRDKLTRVGWSR